MCEKLIKNSQPFGKKFQKTVGGGFFFDSHCRDWHIDGRKQHKFPNIQAATAELSREDLYEFYLHLSTLLLRCWIHITSRFHSLSVVTELLMTPAQSLSTAEAKRMLLECMCAMDRRILKPTTKTSAVKATDSSAGCWSIFDKFAIQSQAVDQSEDTRYFAISADWRLSSTILDFGSRRLPMSGRVRMKVLNRILNLQSLALLDLLSSCE